MEPLSALSIATAVVQFLDFTGTIVSGTWKIYKSNPGDSEERNSDIRTVTDSLMKLNKELCDAINYPNLKPFSSQDQQISKLGERCNELGEQLISALNRLRSQNKHQLWESFRLALRTIWSENEISTLQQSLESYRQQISMHILVSLREQIAATHESQRQHDWQTQTTLDQTQRLCKEILREIGNSSRWQGDVIEAIKRSYGRGVATPGSTAPPANMHDILQTNDSDRINQRLLHFLRFQEIDNRYERISPAYQKTFEWVFRPSSSSTAKWADFTQWVRGDDPLYWITGKAGAGKSTLMRFIYDHKRTEQGLQAWAADRPLVMAYFFFWNSGSEIQMSYEGLVRTLLYQILQTLPHLIPAVFPYRMEVGILFGEHVFEKESWTWEELLKAFRVLVSKATDTHKLMFFIDGMDEFQGQPSDLVDFITSLIAPGVKICASSRPWVVFEDAFSHRPHLRLEDLTYDDIKHYVTSKLTANPGFKVFQQFDPKFCSELIENVCVKSSGVFLWIFLVTQSLLDGLSEGERLSDLQNRLDSLPVDLENLFWKVLASLSSFHFRRASQLFQLVRASLFPLTLLDMSFADEDDPSFAMKAPCAVLTLQQANSRAELMRRRINACCKGLLEANSGAFKSLPSTRVDFLHRTVKDFLERGDIWSKVCAATDENFNANLRLCNSRIMWLKRQDPAKISEKSFWDAITYGIEYAVRSDPVLTTYQVPLLNEIDRTATRVTTKLLRQQSIVHQAATCSSEEMAPYWTWTRVECREATSFLSFAAQCQLVQYVDLKLRAMPPSNAAGCASELLYLAITLYEVFLNEKDRPAVYHKEPSKELIFLLLKYGADPNFQTRPTLPTAWEQLLDKCDIIVRYNRHGENFGLPNWEDFMKEFLLHGADPRNPRLETALGNFSHMRDLVKQKKRETRWSHYGSKLRRSK